MENRVHTVLKTTKEALKTCRLCPSKDNLQDIFKERDVDMPQMILSTTGIEVKDSEPISKQICERCYAIIIRLYKYKITAVAYDKGLKKLHGIPNKPITTQVDLPKTTKERTKRESETASSENSLNLELEKHDKNVNTNRHKSDLKAEHLHHSVYKILAVYKNLIIPKDVLSSDVSPIILLDKSEVTTWYEEQLFFLKHKFKGIKFKKMTNNVILNTVTESKRPLVKEDLLMNETITSECTNQSSHNLVSNKNDQCSLDSSLNIKPSSDRTDSPSLKEKSGRISVSKISNVCTNQNGDSFPFELSPKEQNINVIDSLLASSNRNISIPKIKLKLTEQLALKGTLERTDCVNSYKEKSTASNLESEQVTDIKRKRLRTHDENESVLHKKRKHLFKPKKNELEKHKNQEKKNPKPEAVPELVQGKTLEIFVCNYCSKLFDTKKGLLEHEKGHLTCKFCKKNIESVELLHRHINESCLISIAQNKPTIKLVRVDAVPEVLKQYPNAFELVEDKEDSVHCNIEEILLPVSTHTDTTREDVPFSTNLNSFPKINRSNALCSTNTKSQCETIDLTDESPNIISDCKSAVIFQNNISEYDAIRILFRKHVDVRKARDISYLNDKFTQIFHPTDSGVLYTPSNLIILDGLFPDLSCHQIPIQFLSRSRINVTFNATVAELSQIQNSGGNEVWKIEDCIDIKQNYFKIPGSTVETIAPSDRNTFSLVFSDTLNQIPRISIDNSLLLNSRNTLSTSLNTQHSTLLQHTASNAMQLATVTNNVQQYSKSFLFEHIRSSATLTGESVVISTVTQSTDKEKNAYTDNIGDNINYNNVANINKILALTDDISLLK